MAKDMLIQHHLKHLRLPTIGQQYKKLAQEAVRDNRPYDDFLLSLLEAELAQREENTRKRLIAQARFSYIRTLDQFDFSIIPSVNKASVLELAKGDFLEKNENVVLIGNMGTGKTHTAVAFGMLACQLGKKVRFYTATGLINELLEAQDRAPLRQASGSVITAGSVDRGRGWLCTFYARRSPAALPDIFGSVFKRKFAGHFQPGI